MGGQGSQHNKAHKAGRQAGRSARQKHKEKKEAGPRAAVKASKHTQNKAERLNASKQQRDRKRAQLLEQRRLVGPPVVVAVLPLSDAVDVQRLWNGLLAACLEGSGAAEAPAKGDAGMEVEASVGAAAPQVPLVMQTLSLADRRKVRFTFLPPPANRDDALAVVEVGKAAEILLLALPGGERLEAVDAAGQMALAVLRALGLPTIVGLVQMAAAPGSKNVLKERSAAKKHAAAAFAEQVAGDHKLLAADTPQDFKQVLRHLSDSTHSIPLWRQQRPALLAEAAEFHAAPDNPSLGTLLLRGYIRGLGLSVNQAVHIPGAGDFLLSQISGPAEPAAANEDAAAATARQRAQQGAGAGMEMEGQCAGEPAVLATADPEAQESLVRENVPDPLAGEQTWPTQEELMEADAARSQAKAVRKRRLPKGTSDYQAAWILDDDDGSDVSYSEEEEGGSERGDEMAGSDDESLPELEPNVDALRDADTGTEFGMEADEDDEDEARLSEMLAQIKERRRREEEDQQFPDEVDTPADVPARQRFAKYRGLKSFRTSPWDPKESLPQDYARVFAFENFKRTQRRAKEAAAKVGAPGDPDGVPAGAYVHLHVANVPAEAAARVLARVSASAQERVPPLVVVGLLQHECKLCVVNFGVRKAPTYTQPLPNKEQLLLVTGVRSFMAHPVFSTDEHGADKHKMERFLHEGRPSVASVYAPICFGPLPLLAFKMSPSGSGELAASGTLRSCDPDRIVLKKIVLSGYPMKVHKTKAVVRFMFHTPEDIRWFHPVELWTKYGRRGRIREPVGTHGAMKCIFDGPVQQRDGVCMSLYKRVYPKWPEDATFAAA